MLSRLGALCWRLTIFYLTVPSVLLLALGFFLNTQMDQFLLSGTSQRLREAAVQVASKEPPPKQPEDQPLPKIAGDLAKTLARTSKSGLVLDAEGRPMAGNSRDNNRGYRRRLASGGVDPEAVGKDGFCCPRHHPGRLEPTGRPSPGARRDRPVSAVIQPDAGQQ